MTDVRLRTILPAAVLILTSAVVTAQTALPPTGEPSTQTVLLRPGANLVSLSVLPAEASLAAIFEHAVADLVLVRDSRGRHFAPGYGSTTLTTWSWADAYLVHVRDSVEVSVSGQTISPGTPLPLARGWNDVPFLLPVPTPTETALASILPNMRRVEDARGRVYPATGNRPVLNTLMPGEGYRIHMRRADTLYYVTPATPPLPPPPTPTTDLTVNTLAEALALTGLTAGQTIDVRGYHTAGDGGGGLFRVSDQGEQPDGGVVFVPESALSEPKTHTQSGPNSSAYGPTLPAGVHVPHRDWTIRYTPDGGGGPFVVNAWQHLAGHRFASRFHLKADHDASGRATVPSGLRDRYGAGPWTLTYRHTTSPLRLVRQDVGSELNVRWFGARTEAEAVRPADVTIGSDFDVQIASTWAVNLAQRRNDPRVGGTPGTVTTIRIPEGTWRFAGAIELTDGLTLAGAGGTEVVDAMTTIRGAAGVPEADVSAQLAAAGYPAGAEVPWAGYRTAPGGTAVPEVPGSIARWSHSGGQLTVHYRPVRIRANGSVTRLRMFSGIVVKGVRMSANRTHVDALNPDVNYYVGKYQTSVTASSGRGDSPPVMNIGVRDLVLDGNHEENRELWTEGRFGYPQTSVPTEFEDWMRNTPSWGGICVSNHNNREIPIGQTITLRRVAVLGFGSNGLLGNKNNQWDAEQVLIGNSLWNHTLYGANGRYRDLTVTGFAWTHLTPTATDVENLVYEGAEAAPYRQGGLLGQRGFDMFDNTDDPDTGEGILPTGLAGGFRVNGYVVDGRGDGGPGVLGAGAGPETRFEGAILLRDAGSGAVYSEQHNGWLRGLWSQNRFDRVLSTRGQGGSSGAFVARGPFQGLTSTNHVELQLNADRPGIDGYYRAPVSLTTGWSSSRRGPGAGAAVGTRPWEEKVVQVVDGLYVGAQTHSVFGYSNDKARGSSSYEADPHAPKFDVRSGGSRLFLLNATVRNQSNQLTSTNDTGAERHVEFFVRDSEFLLRAHNLHWIIGSLRLGYYDRTLFRGAPDDRDEPGRIYRSEDVKTHAAEGGEATIDIATDLFYTPVEPWSVGDRDFMGGRLDFSGSAAAKMASYEWVKRPGTGSHDWRAPILRVTFSQPLVAGETLTATMAVRPWPEGVTVPED